MRTAIILSGGNSKRFGQDKGLIVLNGKPLFWHVFHKANQVADEVIVVFNSEKQKNSYSSIH
jgi:molybdopterin-guanine dinucleotide biosynthesis protein A